MKGEAQLTGWLFSWEEKKCRKLQYIQMICLQKYRVD